MKKNKTVSVVIVALNDEEIIEDALKSVSWSDEIIVVIAEESIDRTSEISKKYAKIFLYTENHLGIQRKLGIEKATGDWVLILDTDERISDSLAREIKTVIVDTKLNGFYIPYENYFFGNKLKYGNQSYEKRRLFKREKGKIENLIIHPEILINEPIGHLKGKILHYSFRSILQIIRKFTRYARIEGKMFFEKGERVTLKKLTMYPLHMFYSIFIKDQGWRDGIWGLGLALCFTYYEFAKYWFLLRNQMRS